MHSLRAQIDRRAYGREMKHVLETQQGLHVRQGEVTDILFGADGSVQGVVLQTGAVFRCRAAIIASGTYLKGKIIIGELQYSGGPDGMFPADSLSACLRDAGIELMRFKTGTPARVRRSSVDFSVMTPQAGDEEIVPFSFEDKQPLENKVLCYLTHTNPETHDIIRRNLDRSPLYAGMIEGIGPRYCPSIEDKVVRFADQAAAPSVHGTHGAGDRRNLCAGHVQQSAGGSADCNDALHEGAGTGGNHASCLCD